MSLHPLNVIFFAFTGSSSNPNIHHYTMLGQRAARFATKTYSGQEGWVTQALKTLNHLNWPTLEHRRKVNRLTLMYKTLHHQAAINIPPYVKHKTVMKTRNSDPMKFIPVQTSCDEYKYSFWPRTINDWNSLPPNIINMTSISNFKAAVNNCVLLLSIIMR